jgi:small-conductance mechanosensitive channel
MFENVSRYLQANAGDFLARAVAAVLIFAGLTLLTVVVARVVERSLKRRGKRAETLASIVRSVIKLGGITTALVMGLSQLGINIATVLAGAGVIGLAVGFGAQTLVKDCISGFFLILDDVIEVGDKADIDGKTGTIEKVGLRVTQLRSFSGELWYIPNGAIAKVGNFNRGFGRAVVPVKVPARTDVTRALEILRQVASDWATAQPELALEPPKAQGVLELDAESVTLRIVAKVPPGKSSEVENDLRLRAKLALDAEGRKVAAPATAPVERPTGESAAPTSRGARTAPTEDTRRSMS